MAESKSALDKLPAAEAEDLRAKGDDLLYLEMNAFELDWDDEEIAGIRRASAVVGGSVHPDTHEIIPFYQRMTGVCYFNGPILFMMLFTPN